LTSKSQLDHSKQLIMKRPQAMTARRRILAALRRQPVDRLPFVPLIDPYTLVGMPTAITGGHQSGYDDLPGLRGLLAASRNLGCDVMLRHVPVIKPVSHSTAHLELLGRFEPPVEVTSEIKGDQLVETLATPLGVLTGIWKFTPRVGWIPHPVRRPVNNYEELKVFHFAVHHMSSHPPRPDYETFLRIDREIGDDGIATVSLSPTPLMFLIEEVCGLEATYYLLQDHRKELEEILARLGASQGRLAELLAHSPAQIVIQYEDTSTTLMSPAIFRHYCLPYLNQYADIIQATGKIFLAHMCGRLRHLVSELDRAHFAGITEVSPPPTGDLPLDEAAANLPGKAVVGGIDPTTFISQDTQTVKAQVTRLIERVKPFRGVLLGSADTTPRGTCVETLRLIGGIINTVGTYIDT
jgi:hypothetical protein